MKTSIAVIGMGCIFPEAMDLSEYWNNIVIGKDSIQEVPDSYWLQEDYYDKNKQKKDKTYSKRAGVVDDVLFDPFEFGIMPKDLESISVEQIFALIVAKQALIDAGMYGINAKAFDREKTGVILAAGIGKNAFSLNARLQIPKYRKILRSSGVSEQLTEIVLKKIEDSEVEWTENSNPGYLPNVVAGRVASRFNLYGTNCTVDAACASSFAALKCAINELESGDCDIVLTGGVNLDCSEFSFVSFCKTPAISPHDQIRPFDKNADGMVLGDGVGMIVLKRLEDAERDKDKIYGIIRGIGASGDGKGKGIFSPNVEGQIKALQRAYIKSDVSPSTLSLIEAHGTGTRVGDNYEIEAINRFIGTDEIGHTIGIGSVKSQIGHTRLAAGVAGLIKVLLALHHKVQPGTLHVEEKSEQLENSCLDVIKKTRPWIVNNANPIRRAGVSAFGFGGTNYHVVLEEWKSEEKKEYRINSIAESIVLHGKTKKEIIEKCQEMLKELETGRDLSKYYGAIKLQQKEKRLGFAATTVEEAKQKIQISLKKLEENIDVKEWNYEGIYYRSEGLGKKDKIAVVVLKTGESKAYIQNEVAFNYPEMREALRKADNVQLSVGETPISTLLYPLDKESEKNNGVLKQIPEMLLSNAAVVTGLIKILNNRGFQAHYYATWDAMEDVLGVVSGNVKEKQAYKNIQRIGTMLSNKVSREHVFERGCKKTNAVVYADKVGLVYPKMAMKDDLSDGYHKSAKSISDCIAYVCDKGAKAVLLINSVGDESVQVKDILSAKNSELIMLDVQKTQDTQVALEEVVTQLRVLGVKVKPDSYQVTVVNEENVEKKHFIKVNPRIYRSDAKERLVQQAIEKVDVLPNEQIEKILELDTLQEKNQEEVKETKKEALGGLKDFSEKVILLEENDVLRTKKNVNQTIQQVKKKHVLGVRDNYYNELEMSRANEEALSEYLNGHIKQMNQIKEFFEEVDYSNAEEIFEMLNESNDKKLEYFKTYLSMQRAEIKANLSKDFDCEFEEISQNRIRNMEMRELQVRLKEVKKDKYNNQLVKGAVLILMDWDGVALKVGEKLEKLGYSPILVKERKMECANLRYPVFNLPSCKEGDIEELFQLITKEQKSSLVGFLNVDSTGVTDSANRMDYEQLKMIFLMAKYFYLQNNTVVSDKERKFFFNVVRMDGMLGTKGEGTNLMSGGLFGLGKSLADEWKEHTYVKVMDISAGCNTEQCVEHILDELQSGNPAYAEIGIAENGRRYYLGLEETIKRVKDKNTPTKDDVILVTGGGQGITARCIIRLAEKYHCKFVILGRTVLKDDLMWLSGCNSKRDVQNAVIKKMRGENQKLTPKEIAQITHTYYSQLAISNTLKALREEESEVLYFSCDVTDSVRIGQVIQEVKAKFGEITGLVHGAGILADKYIHNKEENDFELVVGTKIQGLKACLSNLNLKQLKYAIFFSSVAAFFGNKGQTDYSLANEVLNKMAYWLKHKFPNCKTVSVNWGPWDGGMIDQSLKEALASRDISVIPFERGEEIFVEQFTYEKGREESQVVIFDKMYF